ncbi:Bacterial extracellular solute-binding protein [Pelagimonas phthalicica]|uniref:Bacterial extracellular solute-binding protein n=1 Tax=Pelagimonas phthalicica TaxID=1037362 RepID=A0A238JIB1_9RHOB|nr:extracellular solute-binding protein [Pelagimonas phthalicica]TDS89946.1 iron(III) transport system substrate-binding protein [Pelagimonas phthalicica]SMX30113.1 Bacterial extracellular solute-binding protein [Pelagimonas phthalicica]
MRILAVLMALWAWIGWVGALSAFEIEDQRLYPSDAEASTLRIISTADLNVFDPVLRAFQAQNPGITLDYTVTGTSDLMQAIYTDGAVFDLAISSAMDLQTKLANDGFAVSYQPGSVDLPDWALWRNQLFAFTLEPAVLVVSKSAFADTEIPQTRDELIALLRGSPERFQGKIGTYDVRRSGFGYLMATQDSRNSEAFWRLMEVMGRLDAQLYCCSGDMIRDVASGRLALAYNVLGSYAAGQAAAMPDLHIVEMRDFTNVMSRTALIPATVENEAGAQAMIDFLLTYNQRPDLIAATGLPAITNASLETNTALRPIRFGPGLLVFLDQLKRASFLKNWESSLEQD